MTDNKLSDRMKKDRTESKIANQNEIVDHTNNAQQDNIEKNVTKMNTQERNDRIINEQDDRQSGILNEIQQEIQDEFQDASPDGMLDGLLQELLGEIAQEDAQVIAPLEAQAAWRKAIRAEAAAQQNIQNENASKTQEKGAKIIGINRWMRSVGSIAAALVVLFAGTYGARLSDLSAAPPESDQITYVSYQEEQPTQNYGEWNGQGSGVFAASSGYTLLNSTGLRSDGADDQSSTPAGQQVSNSIENVSQTTEKTGDVLADSVEPIVIRSAQRSIHSQEYDRDVQWLSDLVSEYDAYYEEKSETAADAQNGRVSTLVIRVPVERLDDFLMEMDQLGTTVMRSEKAEEITGLYMDTQSRLDALYQQKGKLDGMMDNAQSVQEVIAIDAQLTEVITEVERLEGDMRRWKSQQSYSTVKVTLTEVFEQPLTSEASMGERMKAGFDESVVWLGEFGQDALVVLAAALPRLVVFIPAAVLLGVLIWAFGRRKKK